MCCCACLPRFCVASHVLCSVMYIGVGAVQLVAGIFFLISLPVFKVGSNVWTGVWNVVVGVGGAVFSSVGDLSPSKHRILLYLTITVLVLNLINLVVLELGEWRILMPDKVKATLQNHNLQTLVLYARMTTSISSALAVVIAFVDAQFMFCWLEHTLRPRHNPLDHKETVSDIEYIIPRAKSGSMGKNNPHNLYNQYQTAAAQSWVFDNTDTIGSTHSHSQMHAPTHARANSEHLPAPPHHHSPYGKLQQYTNASKTVVLRRKSNPSQSHNKLITDDDNRHRTSLKEQTMNGVVGMSDAAASSSRLQPVLLVEGISNDERHLQFMTSFSRTPSPVQPRSASSSPTGSDSNPAPIYECLERLTEPSVYRSRLNTALEASGGETQEQASPSVSPRAHSVAPRPHSVSPRPHSVALASDQQQYASLMVELERTIVAKFPAHEQQNSSRQSGQSGVDVAQCSDNDDATQHKQSNSDADFSRQLEAALQLIQDLESPNTVETPSDAPQLGFHQAAEMASTSANHNLAHNDRTRHLLESKSMEDRSSDDENTWSSDSHEALHKPSVYGKIQDPLTRGAAQLKRKHTTVIRISDGTEQDRVPRIDKRSVDNEETYKDSLESGRLSSFRPEKLGQTTNESRLRNTVGKCGTKEGESQHFSTGLWSSSSGGDPVGRSASFSNHYSVTRVPKVGENCVKAGETQQDRLASKQILEAETKPAYIINHCNDSGVMLDYSNSDESVDSGKDVVVVVNKNGGFVGNGSCVNGGVKECAVISEETDDDGVGANGGLKNGGIQNGALVTSTSSTSRSNSLKRSLSSVAKWRMFPKKRTARFVLTPELENTILKSESLLHLTDVELVARYDHNKSIQRKIEEKAWQKIIGASSTDSTC